MREHVITSRHQVGALNECSDFLLNGYRQVFFHQSEELWLMKLRHHKNGRTLVVTWKPDGYRITEDKIILKSVGNWV